VSCRLASIPRTFSLPSPYAPKYLLRTGTPPSTFEGVKAIHLYTPSKEMANPVSASIAPLSPP
jgi:hypothetical protein